MIKIRDIQVFNVNLPFRFAFKHNLASRSSSSNVMVRLTLEDSQTGATISGMGESVPRDYVTGETVQTASAEIKNHFAPALIDQTLSTEKTIDAAAALLNELASSKNVHGRRVGAAFCAIELALLDAAAKMEKRTLVSWLSARNGRRAESTIEYGGVIPFGKRNVLSLLLVFYKLYGFKTVKLKVGDDSELDIYTVRKARELLGPSAVIRVDANCAWDFDRTIEFSNQVKSFAVASIEQPIPFDRLDELAELTKAVPSQIVVDESLCTVEEAEKLVKMKACGGFNIRVSKVGGLLAAQKIVDIAQKNGISVHLGAQVGESGILTAAARCLASANSRFENYEGAANFFLLKEDLTKENMTAGLGGKGKMPQEYGIGVTINEKNLGRYSVISLPSAIHQPAAAEAKERGLHV